MRLRRCYPVLTPFTLNGTVVKPEAFVEFDAPEKGTEHSAQAIQHIQAGVVGPDWVEFDDSDGQSYGTADQAAKAAERAEAERVAAEQAAAHQAAKPGKGKAK